MDTYYIPNLINAPERKQEFNIQEHLDGLDTLTPVNGHIRITHNGNFLDVAAAAETIVTLTCDRCLCQYNHRLQVNLSELIWLEERIEGEEPDSDEVEIEVAMDDLVETLSPKGHFKPDAWLYEQLCLAMPQRQLCDVDCPGIDLDSSNTDSAAPVDQRWASLKSLKENLSK